MRYRRGMDEIASRFELLKAEMVDLQQGIRNYDTIRTQIQGWAVTVGLAAAGLAMTARLPAAALLGIVSSVSFLIIDGHRRSVQRRLIERVIVIENALMNASLTEVLRPGSGLEVPGLARYITTNSYRERRRYMHIIREVRRPGTWALYAALAGVLITTAVMSM